MSHLSKFKNNTIPMNRVSDLMNKIGTGYIFGGINRFISMNVQALPFATELWYTIFIIDLAGTRYWGAGCHSEVKGYMCGGFKTMGTTEKYDITYYNFTSESAALLSDALSEGLSHCSAVSSEYKGYVLGGFSDVNARIDSINALTFGNDTCTILTETLSQEIIDSGTLNSELKGYALGGDAVSILDDIEAFVYGNETTSVIAEKLSTARSNLTGVNSATKGFVGTGNTVVRTIDDFLFSTELSQTITAETGVLRKNSIGINSDSKGYWCGGTTGSAYDGVDDVDEILFSNETTQALSESLQESLGYAAGFQHGYI